MNLTAKMGIVIAGIFALVCFGFAIAGFPSLGAWLWTFLGVLAVVFAAMSVRRAKTKEVDQLSEW